MKIGDSNVDNKVLLQVAILGLMTQDKMNVNDTLQLTKKAVEDIWLALNKEEVAHERS